MGKKELTVPIKHTYEVCKKCNKKGAYLYTPSNVYGTRTGATAGYCKYCTPRTGIPRVTIKPGIRARLRKLFMR